ncbi:hypothetical protein Tco_0734028 [Tanacetum coccineum]
MKAFSLAFPDCQLSKSEFHGSITGGSTFAKVCYCGASLSFWVNALYMAFIRSKLWTTNCITGSSVSGSDKGLLGPQASWVSDTGLDRKRRWDMFKVLSLKSNAWEGIGKVKYKFLTSSKSGILCNGALHWIMYNDNDDFKVDIVSFHLSNKEFREIPQPP